VRIYFNSDSFLSFCIFGRWCFHSFTFISCVSKKTFLTCSPSYVTLYHFAPLIVSILQISHTLESVFRIFTFVPIFNIAHLPSHRIVYKYIVGRIHHK
jgi:hypothetical protein